MCILLLIHNNGPNFRSLYILYSECDLLWFFFFSKATWAQDPGVSDNAEIAASRRARFTVTSCTAPDSDELLPVGASDIDEMLPVGASGSAKLFPAIELAGRRRTGTYSEVVQGMRFQYTVTMMLERVRGSTWDSSGMRYLCYCSLPCWWDASECCNCARRRL